MGQKRKAHSTNEPLTKEVEFVASKSARLGTRMKARPVRHRTSSSPEKSSSPPKPTRTPSQPTPNTPSQNNAEEHDDFPDFPSFDIQPGSFVDNISGSSKKKKTGKTQNQLIEDWLPHRMNYLSELLMQEAPPIDGKCPSCKIALFSHRCLECIGHPVFCKFCCVEVHKSNPFHSVEKWTGECFVRSSLFDLGLVLHLGHQGDPCPSYLPETLSQEEAVRPDIGDVQQDEDYVDVFKDDVLWIVHTSGVFQSRLRYCNCDGSPEHHIQLLRHQLFPASIVSPQTAFTFSVLDNFEIDALECKTSAMNFFNKLRRQTHNAFPKKVPDRYRELMRVSRLWRDLQARKRFGFGHDEGCNPGKGELALFCPACPQPGVNLPSDWKDMPDPWLYRRSIVVDGNFSAEHMKMKCAEDDVWLSDGNAYMVENREYQEHLKKSFEVKEKSKCSNHRAVNQANANRHNLESTGIGACACSRHGCFIPHAVVDFQKGERHVNIDYSICQALGYQTTGISECLINYDILCQWSRNFKQRVQNSTTLVIPRNMTIIPAVGKFHLGAHISDCFSLFSLNFVLGAGQQDGEILETLWASLNKVSGSIRAMSKAHRQEMLDDFMRDSNWKKLVGMARSLSIKYKSAIKGRDSSKIAFEELNASVDEVQLQEWREEERIAMENRGESLRIYEVQTDKAPSLAEIRLSLSRNESVAGVVAGSIAWLNEGINLEKAQVSLCFQLSQRRMGLTLVEKTEIQDRRCRLQTRIDNFNQMSQIFLANGDWDELVLRENGEEDIDQGSDDEGELEGIFAEKVVLYMPSSLGKSQCLRYGWGPMADQEKELRIAQINGCLEKLRLALGNKSLLLRKSVRGATGKKGKTRAWNDVTRVDENIKKEVLSYHRAREALVSLEADEVLQKYQPIKPEDLKMSGDVVEENRVGQRNDALAWFWRLDGAGQHPNDDWMQEFYRVNWLRAKARYSRWEEEVKIVKSEMENVMAWFSHQQINWTKRKEKAKQEGKRGHECYASKQARLWELLGREARITFQECCIG